MVTDRLIAFATESRKSAAVLEATADFLVSNPVALESPTVTGPMAKGVLGAHETARYRYQEAISASADLRRTRARRLVELAKAAEKLSSSPKAALALIGCAARVVDMAEDLLAAGLEGVPTCTPSQSGGLKRRDLARDTGYSWHSKSSAPTDTGWLLVRAMVPKTTKKVSQ